MPNQGQKRYGMERLGEGRLHIGGNFLPNAAVSPVAASSRGTTGWTSAYTSTGIWTVTLVSKYNSLLEWHFGLMRSAAADGDLKLMAEDIAGAGTFQIGHLVAGVLTDIAAHANNRISFSIVVQRSAAFGKR